MEDTPWMIRRKVQGSAFASEAQSLAEMYEKDLDGMVIGLYSNDKVTLELKVARMRGTRRRDPKLGIVEDIHVWSRRPVTIGDIVSCEGQRWELLGVDTKQVPQRRYAAFDAANIFGV